MKMFQFIKKFNSDESGQDLVEYALVLVAVGGAVFAAGSSLASALSTAISGLDGKLSAWT